MSDSTINHLFEYCKKGETQKLIDALHAIDGKTLVDERGNSLLCIAFKNGQWNTARKIVELGYLQTPCNPPLISACQTRKDDIQGILLALEIDPDINAQNQQQRTALMTACLLGHSKKAHELLKRGADFTTQDIHGNTALMEAVHSRNKVLIDLLLKYKPEIDITNAQGESALIVAIKLKHPVEDVIKALLKAGANPEIVDNENKSAWLIAKQKHKKIAKSIENHLNKVNQIELPFFSQATVETAKVQSTETSKIPETTDELNEIPRKNNDANQEAVIKKKEINQDIQAPIIKEEPIVINKNKAKSSNKQEWFKAAKSGNLGSLNRMIVEGIDINCVDAKGCTALIRASGHSRRAVVSFLLQQNAEIEIRSDNGSTALSSSIIGNCRRVAGLLLEKGANPNGLGPADYSYITIAAAQWNEAMLSILYRSGGNVEVINAKNQSLFHIISIAAEFYNNINGAKSSFQFLIDRGLDINLKDSNGNTALMILCGAHKKDYKVDDRNIASLVHFLLKLGAQPALTNLNNKSAFDNAKYHQLQQTKGVLMNALSWNDS